MTFDVNEYPLPAIFAVTVKDSGMVPIGRFLQSLNEMIDDQEKRLAALHNRLPAIIVIALYGVSMVFTNLHRATAT